MSRKRKNKQAAAVPEEILAEGSEGTPVHVQADEAGTELHVTADAPSLIEVAEEALADASEPVEPAVELAPEAFDEPEAEVLHVSEPSSEEALDGAMMAEGEMVDAVEAEGDEVAAVMPTSAASLDAKGLRHLVEALVFAADKPITVQRLRQLTRVADIGRLEAALAELAADYQDRGVILQQVSGGYQFRTQTRFSAWVQQLIQGRPVRLSRAQLETLAIVAYRQPITRPEIDEIRGVDSSATLKLLLDRSLIRILGKREEVGRPMLYGTTKEFLDFFSLGDLRELPTLREYSELTDESRKVMKDRLGGGEPEGGSTPPSSDDGGSAPPGEGEGGEPATEAAEAAAAAEEEIDARADEPASEPELAADLAGEVTTEAEAYADGAIEAAEVPAEAEAYADGEIEAAEVPAETEFYADAEVEAALEAHEAEEWPQGSARMAAVTPMIDLAPEPEEPMVDAPAVQVLEGVAADSGEPSQE